MFGGPADLKLSQDIWPRADIDRPHKKDRVIPRSCSRCSGRGYVSSPVQGGVCFLCWGHGKASKGKGWTFPEAWTDDECRAWLTDRETALADARAEREREREAEREREQARIYRQNLKTFPAFREAAKAKDPPPFIADMLAKARRYEMTEKQGDAVTRWLERERAESERVKDDVPEGRQEITGQVVSLKMKDSPWGASLKLLIDCGTYRLYGTCPAALADAEAGQTVTFTATLQPKEAGFGFFSRPSGGVVA